jgi:hypothetical protein
VEGTVQYAMENIGRLLLRVDFDGGLSLMVLENDIELDGEALNGVGYA